MSERRGLAVFFTPQSVPAKSMQLLRLDMIFEALHKDFTHSSKSAVTWSRCSINIAIWPQSFTILRQSALASQLCSTIALRFRTNSPSWRGISRATSLKVICTDTHHQGKR
ncbi:hypothetical protein VPH35_079152 [Triticum aestivum]